MGRSRSRAAAAIAVVIGAGWAGCSFPDHTFIADEEFYGLDASAGSAGAPGGAGGEDAADVSSGGAPGGTAGAAGEGGVGASAGTAGEAGVSGGGGDAGTGGEGAIGGGGAGGGGVAGSGGTGAAGAGGAGAAGTGGASGTAGAGTGGVAGTAGGGGEDCTNGGDDDGDGKSDCADPDCAPVATCAPPVPGGGWLGPVARWQGPVGGAPDCLDSGGYPVQKASGNGGMTVPSSTCPSCACSAPTNVICANPVLTWLEDDLCNGPGGWQSDPVGAACQTWNLLGSPTGAESGFWTAGTASGGSCTSSQSGPETHPPVAWSSEARACGDATTGAGCVTGSCVPKPKSPFAAQLCVYQNAEVASCPVGPYANRFVYYSGANDQRDCTSCSCGAPENVACGGILHEYTGAACSSGQHTIMPAPGTCVDLPDDTTPGVDDAGEPYDSRSIQFSASQSGGSCQPTGGSVTGTVTGTGPVTFCCL